MPEPLTTSIAAALATGATAALSDGVRALLTRLASLVQERFRRSPSDQDTLATATHAPGDPATVQRLAEALDQHMADDRAFAVQIRALWTELTVAASGDRNEVTNLVSGPVHGSVVQARDVQGGITFHASPPPGAGR